jgi:hypothetical protein
LGLLLFQLVAALSYTNKWEAVLPSDTRRARVASCAQQLIKYISHLIIRLNKAIFCRARRRHVFQLDCSFSHPPATRSGHSRHIQLGRKEKNMKKKKKKKKKSSVTF